MNTQKRLTHWLLALVVLAGLFAAAVQPAQAASQAASQDATQTATCTQYHTVQRGETLSSIGRQYGVSWRELAEINNLANPNRIFAGQRLCVAVGDKAPNPPAPGKIPTFSIVSVVKDQTVTIETSNFPANDSFVVTMGRMGTRGVNGIRVETTNSGNGGRFRATYDIPADLRGRDRIAIRLESPTSGYFAYNWFYNNTAGSGGGTGGGDDPVTDPGYSGFPTFSIVSVDEDRSVTIRTNNFPPNTSFNVLMGKMGTRGVNGIKVTTIDSGQGGAFTATYQIPAELQGDARIAIRLESPTTGYFAYNWFYNN